MVEGNIIFDACFISISEISTDARTLNMARTFVSNGLSVCVIAFGSQSDSDKLLKEKIILFPIEIKSFPRALKLIRHFYKESFNYFDIAAANYFIAEDLYSLRIASKLKKFFGGKLIYDSREIYSALGPLSSKPIKQKIISAFEKHYVKNVDKFIVTGTLDEEYLKKHFNTDKPFSIIMNLPPYKDAVKSNLIREKYSIPGDKKILIYQGELLPGRGIIPVIKSLQYFEEGVLCILGQGPYKDEIIKESINNNVNDKVILCGSIPYDELHEWTCSADVGLSYIEPVSFSYQLALPNKLFEYCMARIPTLVSDLPAMKKIIDEYHIGIAIPPESPPKQIADTLKQLCNNKDLFVNNCDSAAHKLNYEALKEIILSLVRS
ncbi:MAG: glycosyltransferase [Ignavibacteriae bacterium]|nr:glycosyltransferase [Ignavibacteriota bacterium]